MTSHHSRHGQDSDEIGNAPIVRDQTSRTSSQDNHADNADKRKRHAILEVLRNFRDLDEEVRVLDFLSRSAPGHVIAKHMGEEGGGDMEGEAAEEDAKHKGPLEVEEEVAEEALCLNRITVLIEVIFVAVAHSCETEVAETIEHDDDGEPDFPAVDVIFV